MTVTWFTVVTVVEEAASIQMQYLNAELIGSCDKLNVVWWKWIEETEEG